MRRTIASVDYPKVIDLSHVLGRLVGQANQIRVTSPAGTDLSATLGGRKIRYSGKLADTAGEPIMLVSMPSRHMDRIRRCLHALHTGFFRRPGEESPLHLPVRHGHGHDGAHHRLGGLP